MPILGMMIATIPALENETELEKQTRVIKLGRKFLEKIKRNLHIS